MIPPVTLTVTIGILSSYRRAEALHNLLIDLLNQLHTEDEIIVLDTSPPRTIQQPRPIINNSQIRYHSYAHPTFDFALARNQIISLSSKHAVAFIDDDALPLPGWLDRIRINLARFPVTGGPTVPSDPLPTHWNHSVNWVLGVSPPGTAFSAHGCYPDTSNTAALTSYWKSHPFGTLSSESDFLYQSGREDAEWWINRRLHGHKAVIDWRQAVCHPIHASRLSPKYIRNRAQADGHATWRRRPLYHRATAIPWDFLHTLGLVTDDLLSHPFNPSLNLPNRVWLARQWGFLKAVWKSPVSIRPRHQETLSELAKASLFQAKIRAGRTLFKIIKTAKPTSSSFPPHNPHRIYVSANCLLGDTVLLRRHIQSLASTFPQSEIHVHARYPSLLAGLAQNINIVSSELPTGQLDKVGTYDVAIVPYYHNGNASLWRHKLSSVGRTFDSDVGFSGRRDYIYARSTLSKNIELHEHENLERLFRMWPQWIRSNPPPAPLNTNAAERVQSLLAQHKVTGAYIVLHLGAGYPAKEWPLPFWNAFLSRFLPQLGVPLIIIGDISAHPQSVVLDQQLRTIAPIINLTGKTDMDELCALIAKASFFLGCCSGPKHLAFMYQVPTFTIYTATEPYRWGATEDHHLHAYVNALPVKLTAMELQGLPDDHRASLLNPHEVAKHALHHYSHVRSLSS